MTEINITARNFRNKFQLAKVRYRILAFFIDFFIFWMIGMIIGYFLGTPHEDGLGFSFNGFPAFFLILIGFFLWPISEAMFGQTIGKKLLGLKVVTDDFKDISTGQAFGRFFLGFIDYIFLIGIIIAATNKKKKRIGDMAVNSIVVSIKANTQQRV